jgi:hypothetical protein
LTPTARSLAYLRRNGYLAAAVERWIAQVGKKRDLFGVGDLLAVHPKDKVFLLVQVTSLPHVGDRLKRCRARPELAVWLAAGGLFEVHGWSRRCGRWECKRVAVQAEDLGPVLLTPRVRPRRRRRGERQGLLFGEAGPAA